MEVPDLYSAIVEEPVPDGLSEVVHLEEIYKKWLHQQQEQRRLLETIRNLAEENKRILKERDELREECNLLKKSNSVYKKNAQLIYSVCRVEISKRERKVMELEQKLASRHSTQEIREIVQPDPNEEYNCNIPLNLDTELKYTGILSELNNDAHSAAHLSSKVPPNRAAHHSSSNRDTPFDCRPFRGPKTPPTPNCIKLNASKARAASSERHDRKREARSSWESGHDSRSKYSRYDDYNTFAFFDKSKYGSRMEYDRSYTNDRKYDRREGYSSDQIRSNFSRQRRPCDDDDVSHHSSSRGSYSLPSRQSDRDKAYDSEECFDRGRTSDDHYRREWNGNEYRRSRDTYSSVSTRDRVRKNIDYNEDEDFHDHRRRYSRRNYDNDLESVGQEMDNGYRSRKCRDYHHSQTGSIERLRNEDRYEGHKSEDRFESHRSDERYEGHRSEDRFESHRSEERYEDRRSEDRYERHRSEECYERHRSEERYEGNRNDDRYEGHRSEDRYEGHRREGHERSRPVTGSAHTDKHPFKRVSDANEADSQSSKSSSQADKSQERSHNGDRERPESCGSVDTKATGNLCPDFEPTTSKKDKNRHKLEAKEQLPVSRRCGSVPLAESLNPRSVSPSPPSVETPEDGESSAVPRLENACEVVHESQRGGQDSNANVVRSVPDCASSPGVKKKPENCVLTAAETKLRKLKESKPILFTKVKDAVKTDEVDYIKSSLENSFRHDVVHYTSKQIHSHSSQKEGHTPSEFATLEGLRIQRAEQEAAEMDHFVLGSEYKKKANYDPNRPTESVFSRRMRERTEREEAMPKKIVTGHANADDNGVVNEAENVTQELELDPQEHDDIKDKRHSNVNGKVSEVMNKEEVVPESISEDINPETSSEEEIIPEIMNEEVAPGVMSEEVIPQVINEEVVPEVIREEILPEVINEEIVFSSVENEDEEVDIEENFDCGLDSPTTVKRSVDLPSEECKIQSSSSHGSVVTCVSGSESLEERRDSFESKGSSECKPEADEIPECEVAVTKKYILRPKVLAATLNEKSLASSNKEQPLESLEWDCEVDLHLEEVDTTNVSVENTSEGLPSPTKDEEAEDVEAGEVEEGEILDDSEPGESAAGEKPKKKRKSKRIKAKAKDKWKGKKGSKGKKAKVGSETGSGRQGTSIQSSNQLVILESPHQQTSNSSKNEDRSRPGHRDTGTVTRSGSGFPGNRHHSLEKYPTVSVNSKRRMPVDRHPRTSVTGLHRGEAVKDMKRFRGRVTADGSSSFRGGNAVQRSGGTQGPKPRHFDVPDHRFRRK